MDVAVVYCYFATLAIAVLQRLQTLLCNVGISITLIRGLCQYVSLLIREETGIVTRETDRYAPPLPSKLRRWFFIFGFATAVPILPHPLQTQLILRLFKHKKIRKTVKMAHGKMSFQR